MRAEPVSRVPVADIVFLLEEQATAPQTIGLLACFSSRSGQPSLEELQHTVAERLSAAPVLRQRVQWPGWWRGRPLWIDDGRFDVASHVRLASVPEPGDEQALLAVIGRLLATPLDQGRPLWELWLLEGTADGRPWLLWKLHHAIADGERALALLGALVDPGPPTAGDPWLPMPPPTTGALMADAGRRYLASFGGFIARMAHPLALLRNARAVITQVRTDLRPDAPRLPFNRPLGRRRRYLLVRSDLDAVREAAHARGATVNDLIVAAVSAGVAELLGGLGVDTRGLMLRVSVPVSLRRTGNPEAGNAVGGMKVAVPLDTDPADPRALLDAVASATRARKAGSASWTGFGVLGSELMPVPLLRALLGRALRGDQRFINVYVTDLIGPPTRVSIAGVELTEAFPIGPLSAGVGLGAAALSYAGKLAITVLVDPEACPHPELVAAGIEQFLRRLTASA